MSKHNTYGSICEIMAAAELFPYQFQVYQGGFLMASVGEATQGIKRLRFTGNFNNGYFDALIDFVESMHGGNVHVSSDNNVQKSKENVSFLVSQTNENVSVAVSQSQLVSNINLSNLNLNSDDNVQQNDKNVSFSVSQPKENVSVERKKRRKRFTNAIRNKQLRQAASKYNKFHPEVNRVAAAKYTKSHPEVNREAVKRYVSQNQHVNQAAVVKYNQKRLQIKLAPWQSKTLSGFHYKTNIDYGNDKIVNIGKRLPCIYCRALKWMDEPPEMCCSGGQVQLPTIEPYPEPLNSLLIHQDPLSEHFLFTIRKYNGCFQMTSFGAKEVKEGNYMPTFKIQGQVYHRIGSLMAEPHQHPSFLQLYFLGDDKRESEIRCGITPGIKPELVSQLQKSFHKNNKYILDFKAAIDSVPKDQKEFKVVINADRKPRGQHKGRFNVPQTNEVAVVIVGQAFEKRDIILYSIDNKLIRISETHRAYDALQYPLMFFRGEDGYYINIPKRDAKTRSPLKKTVSASEFYSYRLMERVSEICHLVLFRNLFNQFLVDMYTKIETERLNWIRNNQTKLRSEEYIHLKDAMVKRDGQFSELGRMVVLPSSFTGGPRYMHERTQDAMTDVRHFGRPDLFITFTCNPKWSEIEDLLRQGQKSYDRHDIIARVFCLKVKHMMNLLTKGCIFGNVRCNMYTVEWQKRGLPHVHILLWLEEKIRPDSIDEVIRAELPDPDQDQTLHEIIKSTMIHGPCGVFNFSSPCMLADVCTKRYPRPFLKETQTGEDGYPKYRRRSPEDGGPAIKINGNDIDNRWVVPFNPVLSRTFKAHINVEYCNSVKSIRYICKYVNKGSDQAAFTVENLDEVSRYEAGRYISSSEAVWRIFGFHIHERYPPVVHLAVHLDNGQRVYFTEENIVNKIANPKKTTLIGFFDLCKVDGFARTLLYSEVPGYYVWRNNEFIRRKKGKVVTGFPEIKKDHVLGRVYTVHPGNAEYYYLRLLLHEIRGSTSFNDLKTVEGVEHPTFQATCRTLGLLEDDINWHRTLEEASIFDSPYKIRELFAIMLVFCQVGDPIKLWTK
ncbi:uncharacterized protein LOC141533449 [Cotesia typhae]|uniref:uncharacterized protein LOC141533449 n=1 Tax=Cotesia typhae TaxID=2053667 RepID=UPI003D6818AB